MEPVTGMATITGAGSQWISATEFYVGKFGTGILNVEAGGELTNVVGHIGKETDGNGTATVTGTGSHWINSSELRVGDSGIGVLNIEAGGVVSNAHDGFIGGFSGGNGIATVTGADSQWNNMSDLIVGTSGTGILNIEAGGEVINDFGFIGRLALGNGTANVTGIGSHWINSSELLVGDDGSGILNVESGGSVLNKRGLIGGNSFGSGMATVSGANSQWINATDLEVGSSGSGSLTIEATGVVSDVHGHIGRNSNGDGTAVVTGAGSQWNNSSSFNVGHDGNGTLNIEAGGIVTNSAAGYIGRNFFGSGTATVTGADSRWDNSSFFYVGFSGIGSLNVEAGGSVLNEFGYIGRNPNSLGIATVTGNGSQWNNSASLFVGGTGGAVGGIGTLNIRDSGIVTVADRLKIWNEGTVNLESGILKTNSVDIIASGSEFNMTGGRLNVETFIGDLVQDDGELAPGDSLGKTMISGHYALNDGLLDIEIGGTLAGSEFDQLVVAGDVSLAGSLNVGLISPFELTAGHQFIIVQVGGNLSGNFIGLREGDVVGTFGVADLKISYTGGDGNDVVLFADEPSLLLGDVDLDGVVNLLDVNPFVTLLSSGKFQAQADTNQDGIVNLLEGISKL